MLGPVLPRSFRLRLLLVILLVALVPVGLVGVWTTQRAARTGEDLLRARVVEALNFTTTGIWQRWVQQRSALLDLADLTEVREALAHEEPGVAPAALHEVAVRFTSVAVLRPDGPPIWRVEAERPPGAFVPPGLPLVVPVYASVMGDAIGAIEAVVPVTGLLPPERSRPGSIGAIVGIYDRGGRTPYVPLPFDPPPVAGALAWGGDEWLVVSRELAEPPVRVVGAAPLSPFRAPAEEAARASLWILLIVAGAGVALTTMLAAQMTKSLERLAEAAEAVSGGGLDRQVEASGADEVARAARAFNRMTSSLRTTLQELANQRALARVGEFAATLAHEVRNPLTAMRVDLQVVQELIPAEHGAHRPLSRALDEIDRLDRTVTAALLATRGARGDRQIVDLRAPLHGARDTASKTSPRPLEIPIEAPEAPVLVAGDHAALEQLFLNLLLNAVDAVRQSGDVRVRVETAVGRAVVRVIDTGAGLTPETARRAFDPFFTTREGGTGLGLTIAFRLARAHDGDLTLDGAPGEGAVATIALPLAEPVSGDAPVPL
jgi:signal transduction histidine kinase